METDLNYFQKVYDFLPTNSVKVAESGFTTSEQIKEIYNLGFDAFLIGTSLMRSGSPGKSLKKLLEGSIDKHKGMRHNECFRCTFFNKMWGVSYRFYIL